jgi:hypothetical protein
MKTKKIALAVKTNVKAGGLSLNHNRRTVKAGLAVKSAVKAGVGGLNHNRAAI